LAVELTDRIITASAPVIETERLRLRGHRVEDFVSCAAMWADREVTRHISGRPFAPEETWTKLLRYVGHWTLLGYGFWAIEERASGRFAGEAGFADFKRDMQPSLDGTPEIGWVLAPWAHGRGFATEAVRAAVAWGDAHFGPAVHTACITGPDNAASIRVAEKCGYREFARPTYKGEPVVMFRR
jgi:RimJ/RimL family protein N-acetyltransferase